MKALVVEDNALVLSSLVDELSVDYVVIASTTGEQASAHLEDPEIALVVSDYDLGTGAERGLTGDELLARAHALRPSTDRVLLVGARNPALPEPRGEHAHLVLGKPLRPGELLAAVRRQRAGLPDPHARRAQVAFPRRRMVVVVDDSVDAQELIRDALEPGGFIVTAASSGPEALELLLDHTAPGLLIVDLMMPGMNGMELIGSLHSYRKLNVVPLLILSGVKVPEPARLPGIRYLEKPFDPAELLGAVRDLTGMPATGPAPAPG